VTPEWTCQTVVLVALLTSGTLRAWDQSLVPWLEMDWQYVSEARAEAVKFSRRRSGDET